MKNKFVFLLTASLMLSGCAMIPKYSKPETTVPSEWPSGEAYLAIVNSDTAADITHLKWRDFFKDEKLQKVIAVALNKNADLRIAAENTERAQGLYGVRRAELFPVINAYGSGGEQQKGVDFISKGAERTSKSYEVNLGITSWELDFWGRIRSLKKQALEDYLATEQAGAAARLSLISAVANAYFSLAADSENLELAKNTLQSQTSAYELVKKQFDLGVVTAIDLYRAKTPVDVAKRDVAFYTQLAARSRNALNYLVGAVVPNDLISTDLEMLTPPSDISIGLSSDALLKRPDVLSAEHQLKSAYANVGAARAAFFPQISLTTALGSATSDLSGLFKSGTETWIYAAQFALPIFDARTWSAYRVSKADQKLAITQYKKSIQSAFREVADTLAIKGTIEAQLSAQEDLVNTVSETYKLANSRYSAGIDDYLSVLDAQQTLFQARQALVDLREQKLVNQVALYTVLGGGSETGEEITPEEFTATQNPS